MKQVNQHPRFNRELVIKANDPCMDGCYAGTTLKVKQNDKIATLPRHDSNKALLKKSHCGRSCNATCSRFPGWNCAR